MSKILLGILIFVLVLVVFNCDKEYFTSRTPVCNDVDGRCYPVVENFDPTTYELASNTMAELNQFAIKLIRHMRNKYLWNKSSPYKQNMTALLLRNYDPDAIIENNPPGSENTSYVEDKGKIFALCLREKKSGKNNLHSKHILEFVVLHEMAHLCNESFGHEIEFWTDFKILMNEAYSLGIHTPTNYAVEPFVYCSLKVDYSPYFDDSIEVPE